MESLIIVIIGVMLIILVSVLIAKINNISTKIDKGLNNIADKFIDNINLENVNVALSDCFSQEVIDVYKDVMENTNGWELKQCTLERKSDNTEIWAANDIENRRFHSGENKEEINKKLTHYDKLLLDKIVKEYLI